jgi:hypothetical protein
MTRPVRPNGTWSTSGEFFHKGTYLQLGIRRYKGRYSYEAREIENCQPLMYTIEGDWTGLFLYCKIGEEEAWRKYLFECMQECIQKKINRLQSNITQLQNELTSVHH